MIDFCKENIVSHLQYYQSFCKIDHIQIRIVWFFFLVLFLSINVYLFGFMGSNSQIIFLK
jgi:hypothetical protein